LLVAVLPFGDLDGVLANGERAKIELDKTVDATGVTPTLGLTFAVDHNSAIPGDVLTYAAEVTDTGALLALNGRFRARSEGDVTATVSSYFDVVEYFSRSQKRWVPLGGFEAALPGYTPVVKAPINVGMVLAAKSVSSPGVAYPTSGDAILSTQLPKESVGSWNYQAAVTLSPAQIAILSDPKQAKKRLRNVVHFEVTPRGAAEAPKRAEEDKEPNDDDTFDRVRFPNPLRSQLAAVTDVVVTITPPTGSSVQFSSATTPGLAQLAPGASARVTTKYQVPQVPAKGGTESDADYLARLGKVENSTLLAKATATANVANVPKPAKNDVEDEKDQKDDKDNKDNKDNQDNKGGKDTEGRLDDDTKLISPTLPITAQPATASTTEHLPIVTITKSGPGATLAGTAATFQLTLRNTGGAVAGPLTVTDSVSGGGAVALLNVPSTLDPGATSIAQASTDVPVSQPAEGLSDIASVAWKDANGNAYGPVSTTFSTQVTVSTPPEIQSVTTSAVDGTFFAESSTTQSFVAKPGDTAAFSQSFPTINFNPPAGIVTHNVFGIGPQTRPFTDVTTDLVGDFAGSIVAQGNGLQAGVGSLSAFNAVFTASLLVAQPGDVIFKIVAGDGFLLGIRGATRVSGPQDTAPASGTTPFRGYPLVAAFNRPGGTTPATYAVTVHFPTAGVYPYELDHFSCCNQQLSLTMTVASVSADTSALSIFAGYADTLLPAGNSSFPFPWKGSPNTAFIGGGPPFDTGGLRFDNNTSNPIALDHVTVDIGAHHFDPWASTKLSVPAKGTLILAGADLVNFDTSEANDQIPGGTPVPGGFTAKPFATGFATVGFGPIGLAFDNSGNLFVADQVDGCIYKFGPSGGTASAATRVGCLPGGPTGLAFSNDGSHLYLARQGAGDVVEVSTSNASVLRTIASVPGATGLAVDPLSGDLFVSQPNSTNNIVRIVNPASADSSLSIYASPGPVDGLSFGPDGTLYAALFGQGVAIVAGTNASSPGAVIRKITNPALNGADGIALLPPPRPGASFSLAVNTNFGTIVEVDNLTAPTPTFTNMITGGSRGDFTTVGRDHCLYATQTDQVLKVTASDGSCPFIPPTACTPNQAIPQVHVTIKSVALTFRDTGQVLNTGGVDGECSGKNESQAWQRIGGSGAPLDIPLPPAVTLVLAAAPANGHIVGQSQAFTVATMDGSGKPVGNLPVAFGVFGANAQQLSGTTDAGGLATFSYVGTKPGTDTAAATAFMNGLRAVSNALPIVWTIPVPGGPGSGSSGPAPPAITVTSPVDGTVIVQPTPVMASILPPSSSTIASWKATVQNVTGGTVTTLASGTGNPPATLVTFDPARFTAGTYAITVSAVTAAGANAFATTRVIIGNGGGTAAQAPPAITAPSPADGTVVTKPVPINATITPPSGQTMASWSVSFQDLHALPPVTLASGTGTPPSPLAIFDPTLLLDDTYAVTISATASGGGTQTLTTTVAVFGSLKLGRYVTTYQDLSVPVNGFHMEVRRTYDSIDKHVGDFGIGWRVSVSNFRVTGNRQLGAGGWTEYPTQCIFGLCFWGFKTSVPHYVTVTYPDQHQEVFDFTPDGGSALLYFQGTARFTGRAGTGTTSTLEALDKGLTNGFDGNLYGTGGFYNPTRFKLTTRDGRVLILDAALGLVSETDRNGNSLTVDSSGIHASNGQSIAYARDSTGRITRITGPSGQTLTYMYSTAGDLASSKDANGNTITYTYDGNHNLLNATGPGGQPFQTLQYDSSGRLISITDGNGNTTKMATDLGRQTQAVTDGTGQLTTIYTLDDLGDVVQQDQVFAGQTLTTKSTYDSLGHVLTRTDPLGHTIKANYDAAGDLTQFTDADGRTTTFTYDATGALLTVTDPSNVIDLLATYDNRGNLTQLKHADGSSISYQYDSNGHVTSITDAGGNTVAFAYNAVGQPAKVTDAAGNVVTFTVDASGRLLAATNALAQTITFSYDPAGKLTSLADANHHSRSFTYDFLGNPTKAKDALGNTVSYTYDGAGLVATSTDRMGRTVTYQHDADERPVSLTLPSGETWQRTYDPLGRITQMTNPDATLSFSYDAASRLVAQTTNYPGTTPITMTYAYDSAGQRIGMTGPEGTTQYSYNNLGQVTTITDPAAGVFKLSYDGNSRLTELSRPNNINDSLKYSANGDLLSRQAMKGSTAVNGVSYTYDATRLRTSSADASGTTSYVYDASGQLTNANYPASVAPAARYQYDAAGNRIATANQPFGSRTYNANNELTADAQRTYTYDAEGDLISSTDRSTGVTTTLDWDALHQLRVIHFPDGSSTSYSYDPLGRRIKIDQTGQVTQYAYDGLNVDVELAAGSLTASYTNLGLNAPLEMKRGGHSYYYLTDGLGSTRALTDEAGQIAASYAYDAFGVPLSSAAITNPFTYTSQQYDPKSGLYYERARYYDPANGRFISEDPLPALNPYAYTLNDPINFVDPLGTLTIETATLLFNYTVYLSIGQVIQKLNACLGWSLLVLASAITGQLIDIQTEINREQQMLQVLGTRAVGVLTGTLLTGGLSSTLEAPSGLFIAFAALSPWGGTWQLPSKSIGDVNFFTGEVFPLMGVRIPLYSGEVSVLGNPRDLKQVILFIKDLCAA